MKILSLLLALTASLTSVVAVEIHTSPQTAYEQAVNSYVDAATQEIRAIRDSVDAEVKAAPDAQKERFDAVYQKLDRCDKLIAELKVAGPSTFDKVKIQFEKSRAEATKALAKARTS